MGGAIRDNITLIAAVRTLHSEGNDLLAAVSSLVLHCIDKEDSPLSEVKQRFQKAYITEIPEDMLRTILKRLKHKNLVEYESKFSNIRLKIPEGVQRRSDLQDSTSSLQREFSSLIEGMKVYYASRKYPLPGNFEKELIDFIDQNIGDTSSLMSGSGVVGCNQKRVAGYIACIEKSDPAKFKLLQNVFFGRVYIDIIKTRSDYSKNVTLKPVKIYLDTNIILSVLGFDDKADKQRADELLQILRQTPKIELLVFDETVSEARQRIHYASNEMQTYSGNIAVDSLAFRLKRAGYTKESLVPMIENLETSITDQGIKIVPLPTINEESKVYKEVSESINSESVKLDRQKAPKTLRHDTLILCAIKALRENMTSNLFEKSQQIFVTPDIAINAVSRNQAKKIHTYPLSISVIEIVSTLWMRHIGNEDIANSLIRQSIMAYVRERAISQSLWNKFIAAIEEAKNNNRLTRDDIAMIISDDETRRILAEKQDDAPEQLVSDSYIKSLRKIRESESRERESAINKVQNVEDYINKRSKKLASCVVKTIAGLLFVIVMSVIGILIKIFGVNDFVNWLTLVGIMIVLFFALVFGVQDKVQWIINMRSNFMMKIESAISKNMHKNFFKDDS
ncbi:MAG: hypothetical protein D8G53_02110 [Candidatus Saccharimonas sp.]|nr:MAG: hypothetical protein D8G53_02110 [Candidatus Saccharimonas sp.]